MAAILEEVTLISRIEIDEFDNVHVRRSTRILKDGVQIGEPLLGFHGVLRGTPIMTDDAPADSRM